MDNEILENRFYFIISQEQAEKIAEAVGKLVKYMIEAVRIITERLYEIFKPYIVNIIAVFKCPNKRVLWLALYHRKRRVRKKNMKRALKIIEQAEEERAK